MSFDGIWEVTPNLIYQITNQTLIILNATDVGCSGVASIYYEIDDGEWKEYIEPFTIAEQGIHVVYYYAVDKLGNTCTVTGKIIQVGGGEPTTVCHITPSEPTGKNGWYICNVTVTLTATDEASGVDYTMYRIDGGEWRVYKNAFIVGEGVHTIQYRSVDVAGNVENVKEKRVKIDLHGPEINIHKPVGFLYIFDREILPLPENKTVIIGKITIVASIQDALSGVDTAEIYIDDNLKATFDESIKYTLDETIFGIHTIKIIAYDKAGNEAIKQIEVKIYNIRSQ